MGQQLCEWGSGLRPDARSAPVAEIMSGKSHPEPARPGPARPADTVAKVPFLRFFFGAKMLFA